MKQLNQQVKRNAFRFPADFMFPLSFHEVGNLKSQFVTSSSAWGGRRKSASAFTEQGVAMLSSVLLDELEQKCDGKFRLVFDTLRELSSVQSTPRKKVAGLGS